MSEYTDRHTTINITKDLRDWLIEQRIGRETHEDVIRRLAGLPKIEAKTFDRGGRPSHKLPDPAKLPSLKEKDETK